MNKRLIVNADDYGHTPGVSAGIREAHLQGMVTSTSVMMNRPDAVNGLRAAQESCPRLGLGVHLVLTSGQPVLAPERIPSLVQPDGSFYKADPFVARVSKIKLDEVRAEWIAQVEKFIQVSGHAPDHLDSHHHSSYFTPALFESMLDLAQQLNCPIRLPFHADLAEVMAFLPPELADQDLSAFLSIFKERNPRGPDRFLDSFYDDSVNRVTLENIIIAIAADGSAGTFELMTHPANVDDALHAVSVYNEKRNAERELLQDAGLLSLLASSNIELISYAQL